MPLIRAQSDQHAWPWRTGYFYDAGSTAFADQTYTTLLMVANRIYAGPLIVPPGNGSDQILAKITTIAAAGKLAKLMVYSVGANGLPGTLIASSGNLAADALGNLTFTFPSVLPPGRYFGAIWSDGAPTVTALTISQVMRLFGEPAAFTRSLIVGVQSDVTFGAAPAAFGTPTGNFTGNLHVLLLRAV